MKIRIDKLRTINDKLLLVSCVWGFVYHIWKNEVVAVIGGLFVGSYLFLLLVLIGSSWRSTHCVWQTVKENIWGFFVLSLLAVEVILFLCF